MITIPTLCALAPQVARIADRIRGALVRMHDDDHGPIPSYR
jgi:hypothetical protein